ncbi:MAG: zinc/cadmium/mercury/lead-transporting ATPase [Aeromonas sp.]
MSHSCCSSQQKSAIKAIKPTLSGQHHHTARCCDANVAEHQATHATQNSCCSHAEPNTDDDPPRAGLSEATAGTQRFSWQVVGMDCPSCARKIETAVGRISGVNQVKVLFATERLIVDTLPGLSPTAILDAVTAAGFTVAQPTANASGSAAVTSTQSLSWLRENVSLLSLAALMALAALLGLITPQLGTALFTLATLWGLWPVITKALRLARSGTPFAIETLMSVAAIGALYLGETAEAAMVLLLFMLGEKLEAYAANRARAGVTALMELVPDRAVRIIDSGREEVEASQLRPGEVIEVAPGTRLPADAILVDPLAAFDESALTGESIPVERSAGDKIAAGSLSVDRLVRLRVVSEPGHNAIDRILQLIEEAESRRAPIERFIDRFSRWYTPAMMLASLLVILCPPLLFGADWDTWIYRGLALLLIGCPCALVISTPAAVTSALAAASRQGALIKGGAALEQLASINLIAFDKTGTLTLGKPGITDVILLSQHATRESLLAAAAAIEQGSRHPLAQAVITYVAGVGITPGVASDIRALPGMGVEGRIGSERWSLLAPQHQQGLDAHATSQAEQLEQQGKTVIVLACEGVPCALFALQDQLRGDARSALAELSQMGVTGLMLTGDNPKAAAAIAAELGLEYRAGLLPADKVSAVAELSNQQAVAMVGDGINDAPAMKRARIGIAMGSGTDVALETADAALTTSQLHALPAMIRLSRAALANIHQNIALALGLKAIFLVTSLLGITGLWLAVLADSGATALVTANALRLLRKR